MKYSKIGVYDSGIGGVSVLKELVKILDFDYIYLSDYKNNPYGDKDINDVKKIIRNNIENLINMGCDLIVVACNTATSIMIEELRNDYKDIIFVATEPAIKIIYDMNISHEDKVLLLATKLTLDTERVNKLLDKYMVDNLKTYKASGLADLIEKKDFDGIHKYLKDNLTDYKDYKYVILGCTHYPLVKDILSEFFNNAVIVDGSIGVSQQVKRKVNENNLICNKNNIEFIDTLDNSRIDVFNYYMNKNN